MVAYKLIHMRKVESAVSEDDSFMAFFGKANEVEMSEEKYGAAETVEDNFGNISTQKLSAMEFLEEMLDIDRETGFGEEGFEGPLSRTASSDFLSDEKALIDERESNADSTVEHDVIYEQDAEGESDQDAEEESGSGEEGYDGQLSQFPGFLSDESAFSVERVLIIREDERVQVGNAAHASQAANRSFLGEDDEQNQSLSVFYDEVVASKSDDEPANGWDDVEVSKSELRKGWRKGHDGQLIQDPPQLLPDERMVHTGYISEDDAGNEHSEVYIKEDKDLKDFPNFPGGGHEGQPNTLTGAGPVQTGYVREKGISNDHSQVGIENKALRREVRKVRGELKEFLSERKKKLAKAYMADYYEGQRSQPIRSGNNFRKREPTPSEVLNDHFINSRAGNVDEAHSSLKSLDQFVATAEDEVEFEVGTDGMWTTIKSEDDFRKLAEGDELGLKSSFESRWERDSMDRQLQEEVGMWKEKARQLEQQVKRTQAESDHALQKKRDDMEEVVRGILVGIREGSQCKVREKDHKKRDHEETKLFDTSECREQDVDCSTDDAVLKAFDDLLTQADERAQINRNGAKDMTNGEEDGEVNEQHKRRWSKIEKLLERQLIFLEMELGRVSDALRETESALTSERDRRKESRQEVDKTLKLWREDKKYQDEIKKKLTKLVNLFEELRVNFVSGKIILKEGRTDFCIRIQSILEDVDQELHESPLAVISDKRAHKEFQPSDIDVVIGWKIQRDKLEAERDNAEEKMRFLLRRLREKHGELEAVWLEREKLLEQKIDQLEVALEQSELNQKKADAEFNHTKKKWGKELASCKRAWSEEIAAFSRERRDRFKEQGERRMSLQDLERKEGKITEDARFEGKHQEFKLASTLIKQERMVLEDRVSETLQAVEELRKQLVVKEGQWELQRKDMEIVIVAKTAEVENLSALLNAKQHDLEVTVKKFKDELQVIDDILRKERNEREQVMEFHFDSKRKLVTEWKDKEEKWKAELETMSKELNNMRMEGTTKEMKLRKMTRDPRPSVAEVERNTLASLLRKREIGSGEQGIEKTVVVEDMLTEMWTLSEEGNRSQALSLITPKWESSQPSYPEVRETGYKRNIEWQAVVDKVARLEEDVSKAMSHISSLQSELKEKDAELVKVQAEWKANWDAREEGWNHQHDEMMSLLQSQKQKEQHNVAEWLSKEQQLIKEREELEMIHKTQKEEASEIISNLQAAVRELGWSLKNMKGRQANGIKNHDEGNSYQYERGGKPISKDGELVKVHASYLEEVDRYVLDLETKMEESEENLRSAEAALAMQNLKQPRIGTRVDTLLVEEDKDMMTTPEATLHPSWVAAREDRRSRISRSWKSDSSDPRIFCNGTTRPLEGNMFLTLNGLSTSTEESDWIEGTNQQLRLWQTEESNSIDLANSVTSVSSPWMIQREAEDTYASQEYSFRGRLALTGPPAPLRRQRKWLVDAGWLEQVRKEHAYLKQQLEVERQRAFALGQVETENKWMESAIVRALELKRESDAKVAELEQQVALLEVMMPKTKPIGGDMA